LESFVKARWPRVAEALTKAKSISEARWLFTHAEHLRLREIANWASGAGPEGLDVAANRIDIRDELKEYQGAARPESDLAREIRRSLSDLDSGVKAGRLAPEVVQRIIDARMNFLNAERQPVDPFVENPPVLSRQHNEWLAARALVVQWRTQASRLLRFCQSGIWSAEGAALSIETLLAGYTALPAPSFIDAVPAEFPEFEQLSSEVASSFGWPDRPALAQLRDLITTKVTGKTAQWAGIHDQRRRASALLIKFPKLAQDFGLSATWDRLPALEQAACCSPFISVVEAAGRLAEEWRQRPLAIFNGLSPLDLLTQRDHRAIADGYARVVFITKRLAHNPDDVTLPDPLRMAIEPTLDAYVRWWTDLAALGLLLNSLEWDNTDFDRLVTFAAVRIQRGDFGVELLRRVDRRDELVDLIARLQQVAVREVGTETITKRDLDRFYDLIGSDV
jgi:hypothetical protein